MLMCKKRKRTNSTVHPEEITPILNTREVSVKEPKSVSNAIYYRDTLGFLIRNRNYSDINDS